MVSVKVIEKSIVESCSGFPVLRTTVRLTGGAWVPTGTPSRLKHGGARGYTHEYTKEMNFYGHEIEKLLPIIYEADECQATEICSLLNATDEFFSILTAEEEEENGE